MNKAQPVVYVVGFAAPPVLHLQDFVTLLVVNGWDPYVILSPTAASWANVDRIMTLSLHPVCVTPRLPSQPNQLPPAAAVVAAPVTFNSLNKWATGINDTLALGLLNEAVGSSTPVVAALYFKKQLERHPAYRSSRLTLQAAGVKFLEPTSLMVPDATGVGRFDWDRVLRMSELSDSSASPQAQN